MCLESVRMDVFRVCVFGCVVSLCVWMCFRLRVWFICESLCVWMYNVHTVNERLEIEDLYKTTEAIIKYISK